VFADVKSDSRIFRGVFGRSLGHAVQGRCRFVSLDMITAAGGGDPHRDSRAHRLAPASRPASSGSTTITVLDPGLALGRLSRIRVVAEFGTRVSTTIQRQERDVATHDQRSMFWYRDLGPAR